MTLNLSWRPAGSPTATTVACQPGLNLGQPAHPDAYLFEWGNGAAVVLCNGRVDPANPSKARGKLAGEVTTTFNGIEKSATVTVHDGCMVVIRRGQPAPALALPEPYQDFILDGWSDIPRETRTLIQDRLATYSPAFDDSKYPEPDQAGSPRVIHAVWAGALAYVLGVRPEDALFMSRTFTDQQSRPCIYYTADGKPLDRSDVWIDEKGWRKGQHGKWARPSASPYQLEDDEHLAPDRFLLAAAAGDPVARFYAGHWIGAMLTRPGFASVYVTQQARAVGYRFETLAKFKHIFGDADGRLGKAAKNLLASLDLSRGIGIQGVPFMAPWPASTIHATHVGPTMQDAQAFAQSHGLVIPEYASFELGDALAWLEGQLGAKMTEPGQLQWLLRGGTSWGNAIIRRGAHRAWRAGLISDASVIDDCTDFLVKRCAQPGTLPDGTWIAPAHGLHESVAPRCWRVYPYSGTNGTERYSVPGLLVAMTPETRAIAHRIYVSHSSFKLADKSLAAIEVAGLRALAEFGIL